MENKDIVKLKKLFNSGCKVFGTRYTKSVRHITKIVETTSDGWIAVTEFGSNIRMDDKEVSIHNFRVFKEIDWK